MSDLQLKLLGFDTAALTRNQLLTCRERDRLDLQYELASLQQTVIYQQKYSAFEVDKLRQKLRQRKVERRRRSHILEDASEELKIFTKMEEQLAEELDRVRRELFMLKLQVDRQQGWTYDYDSWQSKKKSLSGMLNANVSLIAPRENGASSNSSGKLVEENKCVEIVL